MKHEEIGITGFTDSDGDEQFNNELSLQRANAVKNYFRKRGLSNKIHIAYKGASSALNENRNDVEKALNRRVEILHDYAKYNDVFSCFKKTPQVYTIFPQRDTSIACAEGLVMFLKAGIFSTTGAEPVTVKVQEFSSKSDFVLAGLNSQGPDNALLESGGMIHVEAWQLGKKLDIKPGERAGLLFKNRTTGDKMQLFTSAGISEGFTWLPVDSHKHKPEDRTPKTKEMMSVRYSSYDTAFVYSHFWEEGPFKITENRIKGTTTIDTITDETARKAAMIFGATKLGWINCDRFITAPSLRPFWQPIIQRTYSLS